MDETTSQGMHERGLQSFVDVASAVLGFIRTGGVITTEIGPYASSVNVTTGPRQASHPWTWLLIGAAAAAAVFLVVKVVSD